MKGIVGECDSFVATSSTPTRIIYHWLEARQRGVGLGLGLG